MSTEDLTIVDVREQMPNYDAYKDWQREGDILGIAIHHSATVDHETGAPVGNAASFFDYHVRVRGWTHGGYNYVLLPDGTLEYCLDEKIAAYHAGFKDPNNSLGLEFGQYWNNHYLAICLPGWFSNDRTWTDDAGQTHPIPNQHTTPTEAQMSTLLKFALHLMAKYNIPVDNVRGHRELRGPNTQCPGLNFDPEAFRASIRAALEACPPAEVQPGQHVLILWDRGDDDWAQADYAAAARYIARFRPDVTFAPDKAAGRWPYATIIGGTEGVSTATEQALRAAGVWVERVAGVDAAATRSLLDGMAATGQRFQAQPQKPTEPEEPGEPEEPAEPEPDQPPAREPRWYTVQSGDTLYKISRDYYGTASHWRAIYEANRDVLASPGLLSVGQKLRIPWEDEL